MPVLKPPSSAALLPFRAAAYAVQVNLSTPATPVWAWLRGIGKFDPKFKPTKVDDSDIDSDGWGSEYTISQKFDISVEGMIKGAQSGLSVIPDPGAALLRTKGQNHSLDNVAHLRYWRTDDIDEGFEAFFSTEYEDVGGNITEIQKFNATLSGRGKPTRITRPQATAVNETQLITLSAATGGTFTLSFLGQITAALANNVAAAAVQTALTGLAAIGVGNVVVTAPVAGGPFTVSFQGALAGVDVPKIIANGTLLTGTGAAVGVTVVTEGAPVAA